MGYLATSYTTCGFFLIIICSAGLIFKGAETFKVNKVNVPESIKNGSMQFVILDCDFTANKNEDIGLVVKWFFNDTPQPVYQWIPEKNIKPQSLGILKDKLNLDYKATDDDFTKYRALKIMNPTLELSGEYKCLVSTFDNEESASAKMVVFVPEKSFEITKTKNDDKVTISCQAEGLYPEPKFSIRSDPPSVIQSVPGGADNFGSKTKPDGVFDVFIDVTVSVKDIKSSVVFECILEIPAANYTVHKTIVYDLESNGSSEIRLHFMFTAICLILSLLRL